MPVDSKIQIRRHYRELAEKDANGVIDVVADLIVGYLKRKSEPASAEPTEELAEIGETPPMSTPPVLGDMSSLTGKSSDGYHVADLTMRKREPASGGKTRPRIREVQGEPS